MTKRNHTYWTGLVTLGDDDGQPLPPFIGCGWKADFAPQRQKPNRVAGGKEIVLRAKSWVTAQKALNLILGCHQLSNGDPPLFDIDLIAHNRSEPQWIDEEARTQIQKRIFCTDDFPLACAIAAKVSRRRNWIYAVTKYKFSHFLYSVCRVDLEPWRAPHLPVSSFPGDHLHFCHAIIAAYSVVEDLKLTLRASAKRESKINGEWNPLVKDDLEARLTKSGVNLQEPILWTVRGPIRSIERQRAIPHGTRMPWAGWTVRDIDMPIIDAIAYAEWLRSCVASHGVKRLTRSLSPYDVVNVQHLARRLLLESLGYWRIKS